MQERPPRQRPTLGCLLLSLLVVLLFVGASYIGLIPVRSFFPRSPITLSVSSSPTVFIANNARNDSSLHLRDVAPIHIHAGSANDKLTLQATNMPLFGDPPLTYSQASNNAFTSITINYEYKGSIDITVPKNTNIKLHSYDCGAEIDGITGRLTLDNYNGSFRILHTTLSGPSLIKSYKGTLTMQDVTLNTASSFESYQGDITFQGRLAPRGHHFFYTYAGALKLSLPASSNFIVDAENYQDEITTNFPGLSASTRELHGTVGKSPQAYLHLYTYQNTLSLQSSQGV